MKNADIIIVGGGLAGLSLAALLGVGGVRTLCLDRESPAAALSESFDGRTTAISYGSQKILQAAGVWGEIKADSCPIHTIQILDGDSPVLLEFDSSEVGGDTFGWIAENRRLRAALYAKIGSLKNTACIAPARVCGFSVNDKGARVMLEDGRTFQAPLIVGADGRGSFTRGWMGIGTRSWSYRQRAIVCAVTHEHGHNNIAVENFRPEGPFAILPMTDDDEGRHRSSVVWTEHGGTKDSALHFDQAAFDASLQARFPSCYGAVRQIYGRFSYPLGLVHAHRYIGPRMALVAEAAHGIHPIAGQGLNMGFRDIAALAALVADAVGRGEDPGTPALLSRYQRTRRFDNMAMAGATDSLNKLFSNNLAPARLARRTGLKMVAKLPFAKQFFMKQAMGSAGMLPALIREKQAA